MQFKLTLSAITIATIAAATPIPGESDYTYISQCNTGPIQCCNSLQSASSPAVSNILSLLGIAVGDVNALVGLTCSPLAATGGGGNSCTAQPVCCSNNNFNGLVNIGCSPINVNL